MSTQSIHENTRETLSDKVDDLYMQYGYMYSIKHNYGVGKGFTQNSFMQVKWMERLMCEENCRLGGVEDTIKEKLNLLIINCK